MTKSRTLRRAGAVVLSLAMAATTVFAGNVSQAASKKKVTLSSKSKTFAAEGGTATVKIKGVTAKKVKSTTVKSSNTSVATVSKDSKVKVTVKAKKNTDTKKKTATITAKVKIAKKYQKKYTKKSYTLKYKVTVKAVESTTDDDGTKVIEGKVKLSYSDAAQADGSYLSGGMLTANIPAELGSVQSITWYKNEMAQTTNSAQVLVVWDGTEGKGCEAGSYYAIVVTSKNTTYKSDTLTLTDTEAAATIASASQEDDYEGKNISYAKVDEKGVLKVTLNRKYDGTIKVYPATAAKGAKATDSWTTHRLTDEPKAPTAGDTKSVAATDVKTVAGVTAGVGYVTTAADGVATYWLNSTKLTRGTEYKVCFKQTNVKDTDLGETAEIGTTFTAPYVKAPTGVEIVTIAATDTATVKLAGADWMTGNKTAVTIDIYSAANSFTSYTAGTATKNNATATSFKDGLATQTYSANLETTAYNQAVATLAEGVYGPTATVLESPVKEGMKPIVDTVELDVMQAGAPNDALVTFTSTLRGDANITIVNGVTPSGGDAVVEKVKEIAATAGATQIKGTGSAARGQGSVSVAGVVAGYDAVTEDNNTYYVLVSPVDAGSFLPVVKECKAPVTQSVKTFAYGTAYTATALVTTTGTTGGAGTVTAKDQYGNTVSKLSAAYDKTHFIKGTNDSIQANVKLRIQVADADGAVTIIAKADGASGIAKGDTFRGTLATGQTITLTAKDNAADTANVLCTFTIQ